MTKRSKFFCILAIAIASVIALAVGYLDGPEAQIRSQWNREHVTGLDKLPQLEAAFQSRATLENCVVITEKYYGIIAAQVNIKKAEGFEFSPEEMNAFANKANAYANQCIKMGSDSSSVGWLVRYRLADLAARKGDMASAEMHLALALKLDTEKKLLSNGWVLKAPIDAVYHKIERAGRH